MLLKAISGSGVPATTYVDDVFSTWLYTGNGSTQTITNGIDLAGRGGLVWVKNRTSGTTNHRLFDTARGIAPTSTNALSTNDTSAQVNYTNGFGVNNVYSNGFGIGNSGLDVNNASNDYASWTFRKAAKFFDCGTYTGTGSLRTISHNLGTVPGMIIVKRTDIASNWIVYHSGAGNTKYLVLNDTAASATDSAAWNNTSPTSTQFTVNTLSGVNANGSTYVWYAFAHDTTTDGLIQCGSFTTDGSGNATVTLGWEPQYVMVKASSTAGNWETYDVMRGASVGANTANLYPNLSNAENNTNGIVLAPSATGFAFKNVTSTTYIYLAIRRPNKPPTVGTQVYFGRSHTGTGAVANITGVGFAPDLAVSKGKDASLLPWDWQDRLRGATRYIKSNDTAAEATDANSLTAFGVDGVTLGSDATVGQWNYSGEPYGEWFLRRAPGVFDVVCYTGTGVARTVSHGLGVAPEFIITKCRSNSQSWICYHSAIGNTKYIALDSTLTPITDSTSWNNTSPASSVFMVGSGPTNPNTYTLVAYLFATKAGISKVGTYTGNGSSQTINCGFSAGARFVLIKRTDSTGDWYVWDTVRGIIAANDPHLSLNSTAAEVTTNDSIDPDNSGFAVNQVAATNVNVNTATYIYLAFA